MWTATSLKRFGLCKRSYALNRARSAWSVLAQCYEDIEQGQKALQLRIMAAHLRHDADEWD